MTTSEIESIGQIAAANGLRSEVRSTNDFVEVGLFGPMGWAGRVQVFRAEDRNEPDLGRVESHVVRLIRNIKGRRGTDGMSS